MPPDAADHSDCADCQLTASWKPHPRTRSGARVRMRRMDFPPLPADRWPAAPAPYPHPSVRVLDTRLAAVVLHNAAFERLPGGCRWTEGPVWFGDHRSLVWSDIPNN